jgi:antitoxin YefM
MQTVSYSEARATLATLLEKVTDDQEPIIISRRGKEPVALLTLSELESYRETAHLLRSPRNAERLLGALDRARQGEGVALTVEELQQQVQYHEPKASRR